MITPIFLGFVKNGKLIFKELELFKIYLHSLEGKSLDIIVRLVRKDRSNQENRYYRGVVVPMISEHTGYTPEEVHEFLKLKFLSKIIVLAGKDERIPRSSTELSTIEWEKWMTEIREWAAQELSLVIPEPKQVEVEQ
jgi:hypothetical protein